MACADPIEPAQFAKRDTRQFEREVYPVLLRDCAFPACHGDPKRFFRVFGPGRTRQPNVGSMVELSPFDVPTSNEKFGSADAALSMIDERDPINSLLLRKPLAVEAGGAGHQGVDAYGRDVYRTTQDSGYVALARWVLSPPPTPTAVTP